MNDTQAITLRPREDADSLIRNPGSGWILYDDAVFAVANAEEYWRAQDEAAREHASIFYVRWRWSNMEPSEGRYAWKEDANFNALIEGATSRGLRLAFRVYVDGWDNSEQGTPEYVFAAGAKGIEHPGANGRTFLDPYEDDPVFRRKLEAFLDAFAEEFDDPARVDYIDGCGLGRWGEGHSLAVSSPAAVEDSMLWIANAYDKRFAHTLPGWQLSGYWDFNNVIKPLDFLIRRDGIGSHWFSDEQKAVCVEGFPRYPHFAERCYWGAETAEHAAALDWKYGANWKRWRDVDATAVEEALEFHANTFDLRTVVDTARFMSYPELIHRFRNEGGYRFCPEEIAFPDRVGAGTAFTVRHAWKNSGVGVLPNLNKRWKSKYRPAWVLLDAAGTRTVCEPAVERNAEPGEWVKGKSFVYETVVAVPAGTPEGTYKLACAVLNTAGDGMPDLNLGLNGERLGAWHVVGELRIRN